MNLQPRPTSPYANLGALMAANPHHYGHRLDEIDDLARRVRSFEHDRQMAGHSKGKDYMRDAKMAILAMLDDLVKTKPKTLSEPPAPLLDETTPVPGMDELLETLRDIQQQARFTEDQEVKTALHQKSKELVASLHDTIRAQRDRLQPRRPRLKPTQSNFEFSQVSTALYSPFVRAFAAASAEDRKSRSGPWMFTQLPHLDYVAREAQGFCAMLEFSESVERVIQQCKKSTRNPPQQYWKENREVLQPQLKAAADAFDAALKPLKLTERADSDAYRHCVKAIADIRKASSFGAIENAHKALKHHAFLYVMGGENRWASSAHPRPMHKLLTRISNAYRTDMKAIKENEGKHDSDYATFNNPFHTASHTLNRVYEARWALAADQIAKILESYETSVADPKVMHMSEQPAAETPQTEVMQARALGALERRAAAKDMPTASQSDGTQAHRRLRQQSLQHKSSPGTAR